MSKNKKISSFSKEYDLSPYSIDEISEHLDESLEEFGSDWRNRYRIRLSVEEALLRMRIASVRTPGSVWKWERGSGAPSFSYAMKGISTIL